MGTSSLTVCLRSHAFQMEPNFPLFCQMMTFCYHIYAQKQNQDHSFGRNSESNIMFRTEQSCACPLYFLACLGLFLFLTSISCWCRHLFTSGSGKATCSICQLRSQVLYADSIIWWRPAQLISTPISKFASMHNLIYGQILTHGT